MKLETNEINKFYPYYIININVAICLKKFYYWIIYIRE